MRAIGSRRPKVGRLRVVFDDAIMTCGVLADATFEDVARALGRLSKRRYGSPLAVDVTFDRAFSVAHFNKGRTL